MMNSKRTIAGFAAATVLLTVSSAANAAVYDYARVISAQPIVRYVTVRTPMRECWQDTGYYRAYDHPRRMARRTVAGAIIGGVVGHQFGRGHGKDAATIAGSLIGAAVAHGPAHRRVRYSRPVERCQTRYRNHQEQRIDGYSVLYRYKGQKYSTRMPYDPGNRIKVRIDIRPAG